MLVVISNMLKRYSFQIPVLCVQQLNSRCYLERLLIIGLILSCWCYCFYYRSNWFNRLLLYDSFPVVLLLFVDVIGSMFQFQILRFDVSYDCFRCIFDDFRFQFVRPICFQFILLSHVVRVWLSDFRFQFDSLFARLFPMYLRGTMISGSNSFRWVNS